MRNHYRKYSEDVHVVSRYVPYFGDFFWFMSHFTVNGTSAMFNLMAHCTNKKIFFMQTPYRDIVAIRDPLIMEEIHKYIPNRIEWDLSLDIFSYHLFSFRNTLDSKTTEAYTANRKEIVSALGLTNTSSFIPLIQRRAVNSFSNIKIGDRLNLIDTLGKVFMEAILTVLFGEESIEKMPKFERINPETGEAELDEFKSSFKMIFADMFKAGLKTPIYVLFPPLLKVYPEIGRCKHVRRSFKNAFRKRI